MIFGLTIYLPLSACCPFYKKKKNLTKGEGSSYPQTEEGLVKKFVGLTHLIKLIQ
jgi:hypothetical protein